MCVWGGGVVFVSHHVMITDPESQRFGGRKLILIEITLVIAPTPLSLFLICKIKAWTRLRVLSLQELSHLSSYSSEGN